jgi:hypothetical protein
MWPLCRLCIRGDGPRIKTASPDPEIFARRHTGAERDRADAHVTVKDVPAFIGSFQIAAAGELGHGRHQSAIQAGRQSICARNRRSAVAAGDS